MLTWEGIVELMNKENRNFLTRRDSSKATLNAHIKGTDKELGAHMDGVPEKAIALFGRKWCH